MMLLRLPDISVYLVWELFAIAYFCFEIGLFYLAIKILHLKCNCEHVHFNF